MTTFNRKWLDTVQDGYRLIDELPGLIQQIPHLPHRGHINRQFITSRNAFYRAVEGGFDPVPDCRNLLELATLSLDLQGGNE